MSVSLRILAWVVFLALIAVSSASADWSSNFVVHDGNSYTITEAIVPESEVGPQVGKVTEYSDAEGTYRGNFSNVSPKGTPYHAVRDTDEDVGIAVLTPEEYYVYAAFGGKYAGAAMWTSATFWIGVGVVVFGFMLAAVRLSNPKRKGGR